MQGSHTRSTDDGHAHESRVNPGGLRLVSTGLLGLEERLAARPPDKPE